ncbi:MAG: TonB-dependent receptor [Salibacteraceae bacterium]|nr:TonB-dependent receptor [Salibacteraceae bacterium]
MNKVLLLALLITSIGSQSQTLSVLNIGSDQYDLPMIGASVSIVSGADKPVYLSTNNLGEIDIKNRFKNQQYPLFITISYIGFITQNDTLTAPQSKTYTLEEKAYLRDEVVVTAQYAPTSIEKSVYKVKVINKQKIEQMAAVNLRDVLSNELNIRLSQDNILGSGMSMQGISGQNVKIMVDGVPVIGRLDGQIDLSQINLNEVERIEIVEGPLSVNYGSNALAGTINIITKKENKEIFRIGVSTYNENIGTHNNTIYGNVRLLKNHSIGFSAGRNFFDGWSPDDTFWPDYSAKLADSGRVKQWNPKEQYFGRFQYHYNLNKSRITYKLDFYEETIENRGAPQRTPTSFIGFDDYYHTKRIDNAILARGRINKNWNYNLTGAYNYFQRVKESYRKDLVSLDNNLIPETGLNDSQDTSNFQLFMSRASISSNRDSSWINYELGYDINVERASGKRIANGTQEMGDYAVFASAEFLFLSQIKVKTGARYAYNSLYQAPITPSLNAQYFKNNYSFRVSYARGFRAPSLKELYFTFNDINHSLFGNPDLTAERSNNFSGSVSKKILVKEVLIKPEISGYYNFIFDRIAFAQTSATSDSLLYFNVGENQTKGVNSAISVLYDNFKINVGGSYVGRYNQLSTENDIAEFSYSAEFNGSATYVFKKPKLNVSAFFKHQGKLPGFGFNSDGEVAEQTIEAYQLLDATISKVFWRKRLTLMVGCKNLMNVQNVQASLAGNSAHSGGGRSIAIGTGRTFFVKLNLEFAKK